MGIERLGDRDAPDQDREIPQRARTAEDIPDIHYDPAERREYWERYRAAVDAVYPPTRPSWDAEVPSLREAWADHEKRWDLNERTGQSPAPGSSDGWQAESGHRLDPEADTEVDHGCDQIREVSETVITPTMRAVEAQDPDRGLIGLEYHLKGTDRLKEKVAEQLHSQPGLPPATALAVIPDAIRFTFRYPEPQYAAGARADMQRLRDCGFTEVECRNTWASDQYKGLNSRWRETESGQLFEVQFHTLASFEAKQLTHGAYERLRSPATTEDERRELTAFQRRVCDKIPVPPGATDIENYSPERRNG